MSQLPSRYPSRGTTSPEIVDRIVNEGLYCTVAFVREGVPHQIPTGYCRIANDIYIHASTKSGFIRHIIGTQVSFSITHLDALVLAPTAFDHSFNYRSVIGISSAEEVTDLKKKKEILCVFTDRYVPGRIADVGKPTAGQIKATTIVKLSLENSMAKVRQGGVNMKLTESDPWCGIVPLSQTYGPAVADAQLAEKKSLPAYLETLITK